jgi:cobalt-zinc-cadmium efflux system membrane fusion protein
MKIHALAGVPALTILSACVALGALGGCHRTSPGTHDEHDEHGEHGAPEAPVETGTVELTPEAAARVRIQTVPVASRDLQGEIITTAEVGFDEDHLAHVTPRLAGRVHDVRAQLGERVAAGQVLALLDSTELARARAEYLQARAQVTLMAGTLTRQETLGQEQIVPAQALAQVRTDAADARARLATAEDTLRLYGLDPARIGDGNTPPRAGRAALFEVRAPIAGRVVEKHLTRGELVDPEHRLFTIAELDRLWIWIDVYERDIPRVHVDDLAEVRLDALPGQVFHGKVSFIAVQIDPVTRNGRARIDVDNPDGHLRPGMFARVRLSDPHATQGTPSLVVPRAAVQRTAEGPAVFVDTGPRRYERRLIRIGRKAGDDVEVSDGVRAGEAVVTEGAFILKSEAARASMGGGHSH